MDTMKLFIKLLIAFVLLYFFVTFMSEGFIQTAYSPLDNYTVINDSPKIEVMESKATKMNGYVEGRITNNTSQRIEAQYIIVDCYSKYDNNLTTKYVKIDGLDIGETKDFTVQYRCQGADHIQISTTEQEPDIYDLNIELTDMQKFGLMVGGLIVLYYMPVGYLFGIFPV